MRSVKRVFDEGDKVKVTLRFRGREMAHQDIGFKLLQRVRTETAPIAKVEAEPLMEGRQMTMVLAPKVERPSFGRQESRWSWKRRHARRRWRRPRRLVY